MIDFHNKKVLLTHFALAGFGGSENNILQLAEFIANKGGTVEFFTYALADPLKTVIASKKIPVTVDDVNLLDLSLKTSVKYDMDKIDYIVICQNVIPIDIIKQLRQKKIKTKFIFLHMSSFPGIAMEVPLLFELEEKIASKILSISEETTKEQLERILGRNIKNLEYYRNPVPDDFAKNSKKNKFPDMPRKIAVISNHPPEEIVGLANEPEIKENDIQIEYIGRWNNNPQLVTPDLLSRYDCVVSIGKTVQYCLVAGIPIYVYDHFGGQGYLLDYEKAREKNFSGRDAAHKSGKEIAHELIAGYRMAVNYQMKKIDDFRKEYLLSANVEKVFSSINSVSTYDDYFSQQYINYLISMQMLLKAYYGAITSTNAENLKQQLAQKNSEIEKMKDELTSHRGIKRSARLFASNIKRRIRNTE
jgi:hypothetical protein